MKETASELRDFLYERTQCHHNPCGGSSVLAPLGGVARRLASSDQVVVRGTVAQVLLEVGQGVSIVFGLSDRRTQLLNCTDYSVAVCVMLLRHYFIVSISDTRPSRDVPQVVEADGPVNSTCRPTHLLC